MAKDDHWFKFYYKLILISCQGWKDDEFGAYVKLLINQFDRGGLPDDPFELNKLITSYKRNWPLLLTKFKKGEDGFLRNDFMKEVREERDEKVRQNSQNGKLGGKANALNYKSERGSEIEANAKRTPKRKGSQLRKESKNKKEILEKELKEKGIFPDQNYKIELPDFEIGKAVEFFEQTKKQKATPQSINSLFTVFKIKNFTGAKFYKDDRDILGHFFETLKFQNISNGSHQRTFTKNRSTKSSGAEQLLNDLKSDFGLPHT